MTSVRHAGIVVRDLERSLWFYRDMLGLTVRAQADEHGPVLDAILGLTDVRVTTVKMAGDEGPTLVELLCFQQPASPPRRPFTTHTPGPTHVAFTVDDLPGLWRRLTDAGIHFLAPPQRSPDGRVLVTYCQDPEGNFVELVQLVEEPRA